MSRGPAPRFDGYTPASEASSRAKRCTPSRDTHPEMRLRRALWKRGLRYRVNVAGLTGKPDIVFPRQQVVVFCDGDFFHGKDWETLQGRLTRRANPPYWISKIEYNRQRDREVDSILTTAGWRVLRFWESEINSDLESVVDSVESTLGDSHP